MRDFTNYKLGPAARRIKSPLGCHLELFTDSTGNQGIAPRAQRSFMRHFRMPFRGVTYYGGFADAGEGGWSISPSLGTTVSPGATVDSTVVPYTTSGARTVLLAADTADAIMLDAAATYLPNYALRPFLLGHRYKISVAILGTPNALATIKPVYRIFGNDTWDVKAEQALSLTSGVFNMVEIPETTAFLPTNQTYAQLRLTTPSGGGISGKRLTVGGYKFETDEVRGLHYSCISVSGGSATSMLPAARGGAGGISPNFSDAERTARYNLYGWPDVVAFALGINLAATETGETQIRTNWRASMEAHLQMYREIYTAAGRPTPEFILINPWETDPNGAERRSQGEVCYEIADAATDVGVLNLYQAVLDEYGDFDDWTATLLDDDVHQTIAGTDAFGRLEWGLLEKAADPRKVAYTQADNVDLVGGVVVASGYVDSPDGASLLGDVRLTGLPSTADTLTVEMIVEGVSYNTVEVEKADGVTSLKLNAETGIAQFGEFVELKVTSGNATAAADYVAMILDANRADVAGPLDDYRALKAAEYSVEAIANAVAEQEDIAAALLAIATMVDDINAAIQEGIIDDEDGFAIRQWIADRIAADWIASDASPLAIVAALKGDAEWVTLIADAAAAKIASETAATESSNAVAGVAAATDAINDALTDARLDKIDTLPDTGTVATATNVTDARDSVLAKLLKYVQLVLRKDSAIATANATELGEINASGGSYDNADDSQEALRDRGDAAWATGAGGGGGGGPVDLSPVDEGFLVKAPRRRDGVLVCDDPIYLAYGETPVAGVTIEHWRPASRFSAMQAPVAADTDVVTVSAVAGTGYGLEPQIAKFRPVLAADDLAPGTRTTITFFATTSGGPQKITVDVIAR